VCKRGALTFGVNICEDIFSPVGRRRRSPSMERRSWSSTYPPLRSTRENPWRATACSPPRARRRLGRGVREHGRRQDELVFDGNSRIYGPNGKILAQARAFEEDLVVVDIDLDSVFRARLKDPRSRIAPQREDAPEMSEITLRPIKRRARPRFRRARSPFRSAEEIYRALLLGTRDYVRKNGFERVVIG